MIFENEYSDAGKYYINLIINIITLKKYLIVELVFTLQYNRYTNKYSQYIKDNKLIFKFEIINNKQIYKEKNEKISKQELLYFNIMYIILKILIIKLIKKKFSF